MVNLVPKTFVRPIYIITVGGKNIAVCRYLSETKTWLVGTFVLGPKQNYEIFYLNVTF